MVRETAQVICAVAANSRLLSDTYFSPLRSARCGKTGTLGIEWRTIAVRDVVKELSAFGKSSWSVCQPELHVVIVGCDWRRRC